MRTVLGDCGDLGQNLQQAGGDASHGPALAVGEVGRVARDEFVIKVAAVGHGLCAVAVEDGKLLPWHVGALGQQARGGEVRGLPTQRLSANRVVVRFGLCGEVDVVGGGGS